MALTCVLMLFFLQKPINETFSFGYFLNSSKLEGEEIKLLTFNASSFNNKRNDAFMKDDSVFRADFMSYLGRLPEKPDVLCFQEFHHDDAERMRVIDEIVNVTQAANYYTIPVWQGDQHGIFGIITFSCYPIVNKGLLYVGDSTTPNRGIFTDLVIGKDTVRLINIHLHSMNIRLADTSLHTPWERVVSIYEKLKIGDEKRKKQLKQVMEKIDNSPYPVILCGDFNSFPYGYAYQTIKQRLDNTFEKSGFGFGFTLNIFPYLVRLDQIFYSEPFVPVYAKVVRKFPSSDHFALTSKVILPTKREKK